MCARALYLKQFLPLEWEGGRGSERRTHARRAKGWSKSKERASHLAGNHEGIRSDSTLLPPHSIHLHPPAMRCQRRVRRVKEAHVRPTRRDTCP
jgi:hypothetical protein